MLIQLPGYRWWDPTFLTLLKSIVRPLLFDEHRAFHLKQFPKYFRFRLKVIGLIKHLKPKYFRNVANEKSSRDIWNAITLHLPWTKLPTIYVTFCSNLFVTLMIIHSVPCSHQGLRDQEAKSLAQDPWLVPSDSANRSSSLALNRFLVGCF